MAGISPGLSLEVRDSATPTGHYLTWAPVDCTVRVIDPGGVSDSIAVTVRNGATTTGGQFQFRADPADPPMAELSLALDPAGAPSGFQAVPVFMSPSTNDGDARISAQISGEADAAIEAATMIRIRKNANALSADERDRFLAAFAHLNNSGAGKFQDFRDMHVDASSLEAHGRAGFLPWHRAYLLDLEREIQAIDPSVTLPYWRFDQPAPNLFSPDFIGRSTTASQPDIAHTNPLSTWVTDGQPGIQRRANFDDQNSGAPGLPGFALLTEAQTIQRGTMYSLFRGLEGSPHGAAHVSFDGSIDDIPTAAKDPLFFLLHCNVDRLWAKWQWINRRYDAADPNSYPSNGMAGTDRVGHRATDSMWPWNNDLIPPRPSTAPRTPLAESPVTGAPGDTPEVRNMVDYQGQLAGSGWLAFGYDDVPFEI